MLEVLNLFNADNLARLSEGLATTLSLALISIALSIVGGVILGVCMAFGGRVIRLLCRLYLEAVRIVPLLVWLFIVYFGFASVLDLHIEAFMAGVVVFSLWGVAEMMDLTRGALTSIPKHQSQSATALGLKPLQTTLYILFPQAFLALLPASVNLFTRMIKTTALISLIGAIDLLKVGQQIIEVHLINMPHASFFVYGLIFILYFALCYPLSYLSQYLEKKYQHNRG
ncbi:amino acid ABC transporter permease [Helicobacter ailurogastricus]|uniref:ABC-type amino acid transport system, permease component n=2 Tax=Helicobacter ailurogastricus TaxID=1578720 RepID=A0A0K2Y8I7_9HELI|nr:amino acid ABC transporter permease [Helicobacter ailurogastricus]CRI32164.1 ABC-type amino acid transport system, permease component [Helicobacter ailurogastricus]BDQ28637.1 amino acid ABC transporter permease [Helicobacter ailurogastricus]GLH57305.1 Glutamine ABC transporter, permease protein GlnP [Helicobacter ailurogastricus]GLH59548.1 Glutamine ABC transporter, permease protein GlnP [Helicobacter ailurogastricus]GMB89430.1 Glutamine ABC transporter, permease protein GlnP [Helicobacter 